MSGAAAASTLRDADVGGWPPSGASAGHLPHRGPAMRLSACTSHQCPVANLSTKVKRRHMVSYSINAFCQQPRPEDCWKGKAAWQQQSAILPGLQQRRIWRLWRFLLLACTTPPPFLFGYTTQCLKRSKRPLRPCLDKSGPVRQGSAGFQLTIQHWCTVFLSGIQKVRTGELFSYVSTSHYSLLLQKYYSDQSLSPASESGFKSHTHSCLVQNPC